eukprot:scaffold585587_cov20-Prasinocladus_malaysianus.AAC.1
MFSTHAIASEQHVSLALWFMHNLNSCTIYAWQTFRKLCLRVCSATWHIQHRSLALSVMCINLCVADIAAYVLDCMLRQA